MGYYRYELVNNLSIQIFPFKCVYFMEINNYHQKDMYITINIQHKINKTKERNSLQKWFLGKANKRRGYKGYKGNNKKFH